jgi:hypothetical protein
MSDAPMTAEAIARSLEGMGELPHALTEGMDADACPFLRTAAELGLEGESLYRIMQTLMAVLAPEAPDAAPGEA